MRVVAVAAALLLSSTANAVEYVLWDTTSLGVEIQTAQLVHDGLRSELARLLGAKVSA